MKKKGLCLTALCLALTALPVSFAGAEEYYEEEYYEDEYYEEENYEDEEEEYVPEYYNDPVQSNEWDGWPQGPLTEAASAVVMDLDTGARLYEKSIYEKRYPASITKIMTGMIIVENCDLNDPISFTENVGDLEENASNIALQADEEMTVGDAVYALMLESANDAAIGLAEYYSGSVSSFADVMNAKAESLGCVNTHFTNPHGLHNDDHYTCAYDMALIAQAAWNIPKMREIFATTLYHLDETNKSDERYFVMHHDMIQEESDVYRDWCRGGKTGFTSDAWATLVTFGEKDGQSLVCVVMRELNMGMCYEETNMLMDYGFGSFENITLGYDAPEESFYQAMDLDYLGSAKKLSHVERLERPMVTGAQPGTVTVPNGWTQSDLETTGTVSESLTGTITYSYAGQTLGSSSMRFTPVDLSVTLPYQREIDMDEVLIKTEEARKDQEIGKTVDDTLGKIRSFVEGTDDKVSSFVGGNRLAVLITGGIILLVIIAIVIMLLTRCSVDARLQKKKAQEERERRLREEEIERRTTEEIEQELRAAMEEDARQRAAEEAERQAREAEEARLRETEEIIEEIEREQAEAKKKGEKK